ncbi:unnamed protein product, partial [Brassica rapa subsp. narinosa]
SLSLFAKKASSFVVLCNIFLSLFGVGSFVLRSMEKMIEREYMCKFCNKKLPSGKSLGRHIRIHTNQYSLLSSSYNGKNNNNKRLADQREITALTQQQQQLCCRECGKGFDSLKALWNHMDCCHCEGEKLVMDTETTSSGPTRKRSKKQFSSESFSNGSSSSSACEIDQEDKNTALSLMMMSMDSRGLTLVVNSLVAESSENNSDDDDDDNGAILSDSYSSDSDYFMNGPKRSDSDISVDGCLRNNGGEFGVKEGRSKYELRKSKRVVLPGYESDSCAVDTNSKKAISANKNGKCHECPFCFRVFKSGQALGGHKRSHSFVNQEHRVKHKAAADMRIDLNLPAHDVEE